MSSASYRDKCYDATQIENSEDNKQEAANVPAQTINHDSLVNQRVIKSHPPPTSIDQMDKVQVQEMQKLASQLVGGNITRFANGGFAISGESRDASLSHMNNDDTDRRRPFDGDNEESNHGIRYVTSDDTDKNNQNLRK